MCTALSPKKRWFYLKRIETNEKDHLIIPLKKDIVHISRSKEATYPLTDSSISRSHALFVKNGQTWALKNLSTNGLFVNKTPILKDNERILEVGDSIWLGHSGKFTYRFGMKEMGRKKELHASPSRNFSECESPNFVSQEAALEERLTKSTDLIDKLLEEKEQMLSSMQEERRLLQEKFAKEHEELEKKLSEGALAQQSVLDEKEALAERLKEQADALQRRLEEEKLSLEQKLRLEEETKTSLLEEKEEIAVRLQTEKENLEKRLAQEREESEKRLAEEKERLHQQFLSLEEEQRRQADNLKKEKEQLMERLKEIQVNLEEKELLTCTLEGELREKDEVNKRLEALMHDKQAMEEKLNEAMAKGAEVSHLQDALSLLEAQKLSLEQEVASAESMSEMVRKQVLESVSDVVENEFQCPICNELFYTAIMLNCSHTFCKFCIDTWKKNKKDCPNCRKPITSETRSLVVDSFIDKIVTTLSDEMKEQRKQMIAERTAAVEAAAAAAADAALARNSRRGRGGRQNRGRGRGRGNATRRGATNASQPSSSNVNNPRQQPPEPPPVITLTENPPIASATRENNSSPITVPSDSFSEHGSDSSSESNSDSSSVSGDSSSYYGGYGRCYNCGRRGHWANGCLEFEYH